MRKFLFALLAVLLIAGMANAVSIPQSEDPNHGPGVWMVPVYSAGALDVGDVVVWAIDDSTGDNDNWVETTTTANTSIVAGVVYPSAISAGGTGTIAIRGVVQVDVEGGIAAGDLLCTSSTAGTAKSCGTQTIAAYGQFGIATSAASSGEVLAVIQK